MVPLLECGDLPDALNGQHSRPKADVFVATSVQEPCLSHVMSDHDQILLQHTHWLKSV